MTSQTPSLIERLEPVTTGDAGRTAISVCGVCNQEYTATKQKRRICKPCQRVYDADYRAKRKAAGKPVVTGKVSREHRRRIDLKNRARPDVQEIIRVRARARMLDPAERHKNNIRRKTRRAIESGLLIRQPCRDCGAAKVQAHHTDYSKPFEVQWLCPPCHYAEHHPASAKGSAQP